MTEETETKRRQISKKIAYSDSGEPSRRKTAVAMFGWSYDLLTLRERNAVDRACARAAKHAHF